VTDELLRPFSRRKEGGKREEATRLELGGRIARSKEGGERRKTMKRVRKPVDRGGGRKRCAGGGGSRKKGTGWSVTTLIRGKKDRRNRLGARRGLR